MTSNVLIVEDTATQAKMIKRVIESGGYTATMAMSADEGLSIMRAEVPQLALVDVNMPDVDGYEFCKRVKSDAALSAVPCVLMVSLTQVTDIQPILSCGADDIILKSFDAKYFLSALKRIQDNLQVSASDEVSDVEMSLGTERFKAAVTMRKIAAMLMSTFDIAVLQQKSK